MTPQPPPELKVITAKEAMERGKAKALADVMQSISAKASSGSLYADCYPRWVNDHLRVELSKLGYCVSESVRLGSLEISWSP